VKGELMQRTAKLQHVILKNSQIWTKNVTDHFSFQGLPFYAQLRVLKPKKDRQTDRLNQSPFADVIK